MAQTRITRELPDILVEMAHYLIQDCRKDEYPTYWKEIVSTGLFHDAEGKVVEVTDDYVRVSIDY